MALRALAVVVLTAILLSGCTQTGGGSEGTGSASAYVKDAPSDEFREVHVVFTEVAVHRSAGDAGDGPDEPVGTQTGTTTSVGNTTVTATAGATASANTTTDSGPTTGWIVLFSSAEGIDVDLLNTTGARAAFLGEKDLAAGHYQQIRITVKEAYGIDHDGERVDITVSSGVLRSVKGFQVEEDRETRITIDIDLERSLREQGNGQWRMTPVIGKTTTEVVDDASSGEESAQAGDIQDVPETG